MRKKSQRIVSESWQIKVKPFLSSNKNISFLLALEILQNYTVHQSFSIQSLDTKDYLVFVSLEFRVGSQ
jgi:hypothetical protein